MAKGKKKKPNAKRTEKFFLGFDRVVRGLIEAQQKIDRSIKIGTKRVAQSKRGPADVLKANRASLTGSRDAKRIVNEALRQMSKAPCLDQFMNCDPEYYSAAKVSRRSS